MTNTELYNTAIREVVAEVEEKTDIEIFKKMKEILNKSFGEANNQIIRPTIEGLDKHLQESGRSPIVMNADRLTAMKDYIKNTSVVGYRILIHFPELVITNSKKMSHMIRDLYVELNARPQGNLYHSMRGVRTTFTEEEIYCGYMHSHLHACSPNNINFNGFCLGSGEINQPLALLVQKFDEVNFTMLCLHLKNYVVWESIEGNPYHYMANIGNPSGNPRNRLSRDSAKKLALMIVKELMKLPDEEIKKMIKVQLTPYQLEVQSTDELEMWSAQVMSKMNLNTIARNLTLDQLTCYKDSLGNYVSISQAARAEVQVQVQKAPILQFKGEDKYATIIKNDATIKKERYANPNITTYLCQYISIQFTKAAIASSRSESVPNPVGNISETEPSNLLPM